MASQRVKKVVANSKIDGTALTHMREVAYGKGMQKTIRDAKYHSENMRDDDALLAAAEEKRQRKMAKRAKP
jgi:hypothetical protein